MYTNSLVIEDSSHSTSPFRAQARLPMLHGNMKGVPPPGQLMPDNSSVQSLDAIPLLDFFARDSRPTFILDLDQSSPRLAYLNPALEQYITNDQVAALNFRDWATSIQCSAGSNDRNHGPTLPLHFSGQAWNLTTLHRKWAVVSTSGCVHDQDATRASPTPVRHNTDESSLRRSSVASSSWNTISDESPNSGRAMDWTRFPVKGLSTHVRLFKRHAWESTALGPMADWSDCLRQSVLHMMSNSEPRLILWGKEHHMLYNEACAPIFALKHPAALGERAEVIWPELWPDVSRLVQQVWTEGRSLMVREMPLPMCRHGYDEETIWSFQMVPIVGPEGQILGLIDELTEVTGSVVDERRRANVMDINRDIASVDTLSELWSNFLGGLEGANDDIPYAMIYSTPAGVCSGEPPVMPGTPPTAQAFSLATCFGIDANHPAFPQSFYLPSENQTSSAIADACARAGANHDVVVLQSNDGTLSSDLAIGISGRAQGQAPNTICVFPVPDMFRDSQLAFCVVALTPRRPYDRQTVLYVHYLHDMLTKSASLIFLPEEQRRVRQRYEEMETSLEQQLRATTLQAELLETRFAKMSQMAPVGMYSIGIDSQTLFYNDAYLQITGITKEEAHNSDITPSEAIHDDDRAYVEAAWEQCLQDKKPFSLEYRVKKPWVYLDPAIGESVSGDTWILANAMPELDEHSEVMLIQGWLLDISDRKYHERMRISEIESERAEARFKRLAETAPLGMYMLKMNGTPIYLNDAYFHLLGFTPSDFADAEKRGVGWADQIFEEDRDMVNEAWRALSEEGIPLQIEYRVKKPWKAYDTATGTEMTGPTWLSGTAFTEFGQDGKPIAVQGFVTDISFKKWSEHLVAERLEDALETKQQADRFIDMTSHEMRNPLSAILQSADGILTAFEGTSNISNKQTLSVTGDLVETVVDAAQTIILCAQHQKRIVDDILTLSKLDSNLLVISPDRVMAPDLLDRCLKMYEAELARAEIEAHIIVDESYEELHLGDVMLDSSRLLQVVINLLTNAIKFTQHSHNRRISIELSASRDRPIRIDGRTEYIAQRPNRPDHTSSGEWGSGEEIYLQIAVKDSGQGLTEDELRLLFLRFSQASPKTYKQYGGSGLGLFISRELTELQGGQIGVASEVGQGSVFSFYVKARRCEEYGIEPSGHPMVDSRIPTPTLLSSPMSYERNSSVTSLDHTESCTTLSRDSSLRRTSNTAVHVLPEQELQLHILIVEDNMVNQRVMSQQLKRLGCVVHVANHGLEALEFLKRTSFWHDPTNSRTTTGELATPPATPNEDEPLPLSVVLMDLEMPVLGGLECIKRIRAQERDGMLTGHVPVIAVTANARSEQIQNAIQQGMDSVVTKPFRIPELVPQMHTLVSRMAVMEMTA